MPSMSAFIVHDTPMTTWLFLGQLSPLALTLFYIFDINFSTNSENDENFILFFSSLWGKFQDIFVIFVINFLTFIVILANIFHQYADSYFHYYGKNLEFLVIIKWGFLCHLFPFNHSHHISSWNYIVFVLSSVNILSQNKFGIFRPLPPCVSIRQY